MAASADLAQASNGSGFPVRFLLLSKTPDDQDSPVDAIYQKRAWVNE
jgi:hypothetical protein